MARTTSLPTGRTAGRTGSVRGASGRTTASPSSRTAAPRPEPAPKISKDELRAQVEKQEQTIAALRAKSRELTRAAKLANSRIGELESEISRLEAQAAKHMRAQAASGAPARGRRRRDLGRDPGDAVPPGVAVEDPEPMDEEATAARDALKEHLPRR